MILVHGLAFIGPAGVGKTSLWQAFGNYLEKSRGLTIRRVNMDPGANAAGFKVDYDITNEISIHELMKRQNLGPNGAILEACRQISAKQDVIFQKILPKDPLEFDFLLIDTPGQIDSFVLQPYGAAFLNELNTRIPLSAIYLYDATALKDPVNIPAQLFLNLAVTFELQFELTPCLSKSDLVDVTKVLPLLQDSQKLKGFINDTTHGLLSELAIESLNMLNFFHLPVRVVPVSVWESNIMGLEDLFAVLEESGCACGDRL